VNTTVCQAIRERRVVSFHYDGGQRLVEPFCHGISTAGHEVLRGYQTGGYSSSGRLPAWRLFRLDEVSELTITSSIFDGTRPGYNSRDSAMTQVFCCV
jgi:predicted DNA-binding transcriptional regulator YafY